MNFDFQMLIPWILFGLTFFLLFRSLRANKVLSADLEQASEEIKKKIHVLEENSKQLQSIIENMSEAIVTVKTDYRILFHNRIFQEKFSPNHKIQDGEMFDVVIRNVELNAMLQNIIRTKQSEKKVIEINIESQRSVVEAQSVFVPERSGLVVIVFYDLTEIRESERMKREFITNASHQLKTPLTAVQGYTETLLDDPDIEKKIRQDFLGKILKRSIEASELVSKLLKLSKLDSGAGEIQPINIDVEKTILDIEKKLEAISKRQNVSVQHQFLEPNIQIQSDLPLFQLITENLLENAIKYSKPTGTVQILVEKNHNQVRMQIKDQGIGIPEKDLPHVFERFFRSHNAENHSHDGIGIGMAMVKSALDRLEGNIEIDSDQGSGTTITILLPTELRNLSA
jgi:two-component system phosphate regulon sensor histidine kinase PhoR